MIQLFDISGRSIGSMMNTYRFKKGHERGSFHCGKLDFPILGAKGTLLCISKKDGPEVFRRPEKKRRVKGKVKLGRIKITKGKVSSIQSVLIKRHSTIRYCYNKELLRFPKTKGKLTIHLEIKKDGKVASASIVATSLKNAVIQGCVLRSISRSRFEKTPDGMEANIPYVFSESKFSARKKK